MVAEKVRDYRGLDTMRLTGLIVDAITTWHPDYVVLLGNPEGHLSPLMLSVSKGVQGHSPCRGLGVSPTCPLYSPFLEEGARGMVEKAFGAGS